VLTVAQFYEQWSKRQVWTPGTERAMGLAVRSATFSDVRLGNLRIAAGCDVVTVQSALGHKSATTTLNTYAHLWPSGEDPDPGRCGGDADAALAAAYPLCTGEASDAT
jgi:hypothetical protein